jgi:PIN domain nuclease of toxin-antitoxin system
VKPLLLDTHIWIWYAEGVPDKLTPQIVSEIEAALAVRQLHVSAVSAWEIGLLIAKGRLAFSTPVHEWVRIATTIPGLRLRPVGVEAALESTQLPGILHADPVDRLLMADARIAGLTLVTRDRKILDYGQSGHVNVLAA